MTKPTFGSLFAGIGGFELGLEAAGWECRWQIENDKKCNEILEKHWPEVKRYGDIENVKPGELEAVDLVCGGFPCQDLSVAGKRKGLSGGRSGLFWELVRVVGGLRPRWLLVENVPGFLSSNEGGDFALAIETLAELGYGLAWRVLDSQYFGVPQRRRRVFVVGRLGAVCPPEILFEPEGGKGDIAEGGKAGEDVAYCLRERPSHSGDKGDGGVNTTLIAQSLAERDWRGHKEGDPLIAGFSAGQSAEAGSIAYEEERSPTLKGEPSGTNRVPSVVYHSKGQDFDLREYEGISPAVTERWGTGGGNVPLVPEGDPDGGGLRQPDNQGGRQADAGGEPDERQADGGGDAYEIWGGSKRKDRPEGGFYAKPTDKARPLDTAGSGDSKAQGGTFILANLDAQKRTGIERGDAGRVLHEDGDVDGSGEEADPDGVREAPGVPRRVDLFVSENQRAELRLTPYARQLTGGGGKPGQGYPAVLVEQEGFPVLGLRNLEAQRDVVRTLMGHGDPSRKAGINDLPIVFDWRSGGDVRHGISEERTSPLHSPQAPAVMTRDEAGRQMMRRIKHCVACPDSPRYRALGNAVTVQVAEWIGGRILAWHLANP